MTHGRSWLVAQPRVGWVQLSPLTPRTRTSMSVGAARKKGLTDRTISTESFRYQFSLKDARPQQRITTTNSLCTTIDDYRSFSISQNALDRLELEVAHPPTCWICWLKTIQQMEINLARCRYSDRGIERYHTCIKTTPVSMLSSSDDGGGSYLSCLL